MADIKWTNAQRDAISSRGSNLLVSAAAGSGKTAVLAARILALVNEGAGIDQMLVVTFTRAAAAEMRARILALLHDAADAGDKRMATQAMRVERADITTLHGFCGGICRTFFHAAGVDPTFRVAEAAEAGVLRANAMQEALIACYENPTPAFLYAAECLSRVELIDTIDQLHRFLSARPDPWRWLDEAIAAHFKESAALHESQWARVLEDKAILLAKDAEGAYLEASEFAAEMGRYEAFAATEGEYATAYGRAAEKGLAAAQAFSHRAPGRKPNKPRDASAEEEDAYKALRERGKKLLKAAMETMERLARMLAKPDGLREAGTLLQGVADACRAYDGLYSREKEERNLLDFSDLEHCALRALRQPDVASAVREKYAYIFIDEYQDSSHLQEEIVALVRRDNNLFMVGDIKQSIYRFRLAEPGLFLNKLRTYQAKAGQLNRKISLNANYRSHKMLIGCINDVFSRLFCGGVMELTYEGDERLVPGSVQAWPGAPAELHALIDGYEDDETEDAPTAGDLPPELRQAVELEGEVIANRIAALRNAPECEYALRDMVILMRAVRGKATLLVDTLRKHGIDAWSDVGEDSLDKVEVKAILAILRVLDNLRQDIPLMAALRGPAMGLDDAALAEIRAESPEGTFYDAMLVYIEKKNDLANALSEFVAKIREWSLEIQVLPLDTMIRRIYSETGYYACVGAMRDGASRQASLRMLAEHAGQYERAQFGGLSGFLRYLDRVSNGEGLTFPEIGEADDVVRVMSIHKSKGLQFPIVFIAGVGSRFRLSDSGLIRMHAELGASMPTIRPKLRTKWTALAREAIIEKRKQESLAEEARLLYVAMTRAQSRLIMIGSAKQSAPEKWARGLSASAVRSATSFMDWIAPCAYLGADWSLAFHNKNQGSIIAAETAHFEQLAQQIYHANPSGEAEAVLSWRAPERGSMPLKQSVTSLTGRREDPDAPTHVTMTGQQKRPSFMERRGLTATERGDAIHAFLACVDISSNDVHAAVSGMTARGILTLEQAKSLPIAKLDSIMRSHEWARMRSATQVFRELPFNVRVDEHGVRSLLQGIIDCCFLEDGEWIIVDFKSDTIGDAEGIRARYASQVQRYAQALTAITHRRVKEKLIILIETGESIAI